MDKRFELLPDLMKTAINTLQQLHNTPDSLAMPAVLGVANLAAMPHYRINSIKFGNIPISLYILCMLPTGMRKSTNYKEVSVGIEEFEELQWDRLKNETLRHALDTKVYDNAVKRYTKDREDNSVFGIVPVPDPVLPIETCEYRLKKATLNGIIDQLRSQPFVGLFSDEAGEFFNSHSFQGGRDAQSKSIEMSAALTSMWDGSVVTRQTGKDSIRLSNRAVNMMFFLQEETVREFINNPVFSAQGFVHRILVTQSGSVPKLSLDLSDEAMARDDVIRSQLTPFHARIRDIIGRPLQLRADRAFELEPQVLQMTSGARTIFAHFHNQRLDSVDQELRNWAGFGERLLEHALRIAGTLAAFEDAGIVTEQHAACAMDLMDFFIEQRINLQLGITSRNMTQTLGVERLASWMQDRKFVGTRNDIRKSVRWFAHLTEDEKDQLLEDLVRSDKVSIETTVAANHKTTTTYAWRGE
jgi:hypothetical protein